MTTRSLLRAGDHARLAVLLAVVLVIAGCGASRETAVVTKRPDTTAVAEAPSEQDTATAALTPVPAGYDTVQARRFDQGKMWTFDNPPLDYFESAYGFRPDSQWLERARLGALRFADYCSASFVSPDGLVMTNHHCARESITKVSGPEENLLENGFYADSLGAERKVKELFVEQLVAIEDITPKIRGTAEKLANDEDRARAIERRIQRVEQQLSDSLKKQDEDLRVEVVSLYNGGQYSAYTFRRHDDVRLVMAPELRAAFFGGEADNFTYPRYALDVSFFRVYNDDGEPLQVEHFFMWGEEGAQEGEAVFAIGNPGSTSRLNTVSQLEYERDYALPQRLATLQARADVLEDYVDAHPEEAEEHDLRNTLFSIQNSIKATKGQLEGLRDPYLIARRAAAERKLIRALAKNDSLQERYGNVISELRAVQRSKEAAAQQAGAFNAFGNSTLGSHVLTRALYGYLYTLSKQRGAPESRLQEIRKEALKVEDWPAEVEEGYITARLRQMQDYLGENDPTLAPLLKGRTPEQAAEQLVANTVLVDSARYATLLDEGYLQSGDPSVPFIEALGPLYFTLGRQVSDFQSREQRLSTRLARARLVLYGTEVPPDATFSLRIADGVVRGYDYNGTYAPPHTTFFGMYNHHYTYGPSSDWGLPEQWLMPPEAFTRSTPLNLVSTNDITGGNSGSPLVNQDLEVVGLIFDSNIEALPNEYLYTNADARAISVDVRGILESLRDFYDADRLALELTEGEALATEEEADARQQEGREE